MIMTLRIAVDPHKSSWTAAPADASLHALAMPRGAGQPRRLPGIALLRALLGAPAVRDRRAAGLGAPPDHATARRSLECRCIGTESRSVANGHLGAESGWRVELIQARFVPWPRTNAPVDGDVAQASVGGAGSQLRRGVSDSLWSRHLVRSWRAQRRRYCARRAAIAPFCGPGCWRGGVGGVPRAV